MPVETTRPRVVAVSRAAERRGIRPGMLLAEAQALLPANDPSVEFVTHDAHADAQALRDLARWCLRFAPTSAVEDVGNPESVLLDITGCGYGFGGEDALVEHAIATLQRCGWWAAAAAADTIGAAWATAHYGGRRARVVPPGHQRHALNPLPIEALRLSPPTLVTLHELGIGRIDELLALPRRELPSRFEPELLRRIDQALGVLPELLDSVHVDEPLELAWPFEPPIADGRIVETVFTALLEELLRRLTPRGLGLRGLFCTLRPVGHDAVSFAVEMLRPAATSRHLLDLIRLRLERLVIPSELAGVEVRVTGAAPIEMRQERLFDASDGARSWHEVAGLIERLSIRLGESAVLRPRLHPDPQPEFACRFEPWLRSADSRDAESCERPLRPLFLQPQPQAVMVGVTPRGVPAQFRWQGTRYPIAHAWGPERIETGWWRGDDVRRDYYLVETLTGERFWLFRALDGGDWFLHGTFA